MASFKLACVVALAVSLVNSVSGFCDEPAQPKVPLNETRVQSVPLILQRLHEARKRMNNGEDVAPPTISLELAGGQKLAGFLLDYDGQTVLLETNEGQRFLTNRILNYVKADAISSVGINDTQTDAVMALLYENWKPSSKTALTRLEIKRKMDVFSAFIQEKHGQPVVYETSFDSLPDSASSLEVLLDVMNAVTGTLSEATPAQAQTVKKVIFSHATAPAVQLSEGLLTVKANLQDIPHGGIRRPAIKQLMEKP